MPTGADGAPFHAFQAALIYEWRVQDHEWSSHAWTAGPYPFPYPGGRLDAKERLTYFAPHTATALYGQVGECVRVHKDVDVGIAPGTGFRPLCVELLALDFEAQGVTCLAVVHGLATGREVESMARLASPVKPADDSLRTWLETQAIGVGALLPREEPRATTVVFATPQSTPWPAVFQQNPSWPADIQWLRILASCTLPERYTPHVEDLAQYVRWTYSLSSDWRAMALADGVAFLALRQDTGEGDYFRWGQEYVRSLYLDAILLGVAQKLLLREILREVAELKDPLAHPARLRVIDRRVSKFRNTYWWQVVTPNGHANRLLEMYAEQNRLAALAAHAIDETARFSEQMETRAAQRSNTVLAFLTFLGLPIGLSIAIEQTAQWEPVALWLTVAVVIAAVLGLLLWILLLPGNLREAVRREKPEQKPVQLTAPAASQARAPRGDPD